MERSQRLKNTDNLRTRPFERREAPKERVKDRNEGVPSYRDKDLGTSYESDSLKD